MGKSKQKTAIYGTAVHGAGTQKKYRKMWNKQLRQKLKEVETHEEAKSLYELYGNEWASPRDGKSYFRKPFEHQKRLISFYEYIMRK